MLLLKLKYPDYKVQDNKSQKNASLELLWSQNTCPFHRDKELARALTLNNVVQVIFVIMISPRSNSNPALHPNCRGLQNILHLCYFKKKNKLILCYSYEKEPDTSQKSWVGYSVKKDACCFVHRRGKKTLSVTKESPFLIRFSHSSGDQD